MPIRWLQRTFLRDLRTWRADAHPHLEASQSGEDGIIAEICRRLNIDTDWFVEFGAGDGVRYSNTYALAQRGWRGVYIEADPHKFQALTRRAAEKTGLHACQAFITAEGATRIDALLARYPVPADLALMSIDIDGNDYWVWKSIVNYHPRIVVIEYNCNFEPHEAKTIAYDPAHTWDGTMYYGASARALVELGRAKGYTLVSYTRNQNLFFVRDDQLAGRFKPVSISGLRRHRGHAQQRREQFIDIAAP
jgi:hypothetical protein